MIANNNLFSEAEEDVPEWMEEINQYVPDVDIANPDLDDSYAITQGASHEDETDHVYGRTGIFDACVTITHFWDPDDGPDSTNDSGACHFNDPNAWQKASRLWGMALGQYYIGNKASAYEYLGHVVHLLGDMTVPAHAHYDMHFDEDRYDDCFINGQCPNSNYPDGNLPEYLTGSERFNVQQLGMVQIPEGTGLLPLYWLFYTTAQVADYYPSDGEPGDANDPFYEPDLVDFSLLDPLPGGIGSDQIDGCDCDDATASCTIGMETIRENSYFNGIRAVAALYKLFHDTVTQQGELTVYLKSVTTLEEGDVPPLPPAFWDDPDYFVNVFIGNLVNGERRGLLNFNKGELTDPVAEGETSPLPITSGSNGWAFAYVFDPAAPIRVEIELWDDDSLEGCPDNFEQYDIYTNPDNTERALWLDVNLEACKAGTPGAITGDITTTCRVQIVSPGDDVPYSQIEFYIIPPNSPPVADAGPDQEVNEGDWVTLNGTFTDPDPEDTHTFLWELVSSSNGQPVSDSTAQSLSFEPCDNGVYTFSFTVTDNHGAQGSDTLVVTVLNVPPVVDAPYISNQENAEFILPVVHETDFKGWFSDAGKCDTHTALWDWGDGTTSDGVVTEFSGSGSVTNSHTYSLPGDYTVMLIVIDDDFGHDSNTIIDQVHVADVDEALDIFNAYIQSLPNSKFKNSANQRKAAFNNMFLSLDNMLAVKNYRGMILSMNSNIRTKFDGLVGGNPKDDWIIKNLAVQTDLCQKVDDITEYLRYLLSTMP
jgi:PKD repeat protein